MNEEDKNKLEAIIHRAFGEAEQHGFKMCLVMADAVKDEHGLVEFSALEWAFEECVKEENAKLASFEKEKQKYFETEKRE